MKAHQLLQVSIVALASSLFSTLLSTARAGQEPQAPATPQEPIVKVELLADTSALAPGAEFMLAAYFELPEHFHIYWENAGQSGMPTTVKVSAPEGFEVGDALYPGPKSLEVALDIVSYVYEGQVAIFVPMKSPANLEAGQSYEFKLEAQWLVCRKECFLQEAKRSITLKVHEGAGKPPQANAKKLDSQRERLPRPRTELPELRYQWMASPPDYRALMVVRRAAEVEFFPSLETNMTISRIVDNPGSNGYELAIDFESTAGQERDTPIAMGVLRVVRNKQTRFYSVNFSEAPK